MAPVTQQRQLLQAPHVGERRWQRPAGSRREAGDVQRQPSQLRQVAQGRREAGAQDLC